MIDFAPDGLNSGWYGSAGPEDDVVVSTRLRLSRNISGYAFASELGAEEELAVQEAVGRAFQTLGGEYSLCPMEELTPVDRRILLERNLISQDFSLQTAKSAIIREDFCFSAMMNEVDHLRMALIRPGKDFSSLWSELEGIDGRLEDQLDFSVSLEWGYLTPDVANVGTGLKASAMCHLPALVETGMIEKALKAVVQLGFSVRGFFSDGENSLGYLYLIANPVAIGESEEELTAKLDGVVNQLVHYERTAREEMLKRDRISLEDKIFRALGTLLHCRLLESKEAIDALNLIRFGIECELISLPVHTVTALLFLSQKSHIQKLIESSGEKEIPVDAYRAKMVRDTLTAGMAGGRNV